MADKQVQTECSYRALSRNGGSSKLSECGKCAELQLQLLQALNELRSDELIVDLLNKECKQDDQVLSAARNDHWIHVPSNHQNKHKISDKSSIHYIPTTSNHYELLSNLMGKTSYPVSEKDKELRNCLRCLQGESVHSKYISMDSYKTSATVLKSKCNKHETAIHSGHRNRQSPTCNSSPG